MGILKICLLPKEDSFYLRDRYKNLSLWNKDCKQSVITINITPRDVEYSQVSPSVVIPAKAGTQGKVEKRRSSCINGKQLFL
jgi:hypothetical protein